jgi:PhzF family phenazine biosynthesis protein
MLLPSAAMLGVIVVPGPPQTRVTATGAPLCPYSLTNDPTAVAGMTWPHPSTSTAPCKAPGSLGLASDCGKLAAMQAFVVDAFTDRPFAGNPAAVCLGTGDEAWMQQVAAEFNLAETAFLAGGPGSYDLRWFTPQVEVDLCGHATLAAAHVLWESGETADVLQFRTRSGVLTAERTAGEITLGLPADNPIPVTEDVSPLLAALGVPAPRSVHRGRDDYLIEVADADAVRAVRPDFAALRAIPTRGVIVTAMEGAAAVDADVVSRFFGPAVGIDEDPVTGSAHCLLGPFWGPRIGRTTLRAVQLSARGGRLGVEVGPETVRLTGAAVTVLRGQLHS